ncbi:MAG: hypothetical protein JW920_05795 [Deltaproteobacteria bacterium]|nr:hypothetical protein [Deltaproteobacteria bacterium]
MIRILYLMAFLAIVLSGCAGIQTNSPQADDDFWENTPMEDRLPEDDPIGPVLRRKD